MFLNNTLDFTKFFRGQFVMDSQGDNGFYPKFCFPAFARQVNMDAVFFV
jgi:hypothetical protein